MQRLKEGERSGGSESGERRCDVVDWLNGVDSRWVGGWMDGRMDGVCPAFQVSTALLSFMVEFGSVQAQPTSASGGREGGRLAYVQGKCVYLAAVWNIRTGWKGERGETVQVMGSEIGKR